MGVNGLSNLTLLRLPHDHNGSFGTAIAGLGTPALQISDNDYAIGRVVDIISHSPYWSDTAIFILEDDAQNGSDHVDSHRSFAYVISPYSKRGVTISTNYNTVNVLRTIEDVMGINHLNFRDADAAPMADVFTRKPDYTPYSAIIPGDLLTAPVNPKLVPACETLRPRSLLPFRSCTTRRGGRQRRRVLTSPMPTGSMPTPSTASCGRAAWATTSPTRQYAAIRTCDRTALK